jgi:catalase
VPGIGPSADKMLQGRLFSYHDTHLHRLGPNYHLLPVNSPKHALEASYQRDGAMRSDGNGGAGPNYWPNSFGAPGPDASVSEPGMPLAGETGRTRYPHENVDCVQVCALFRDVMTDEDRDHLVSNIVGHLSGAQTRIRLRQCAVFYKVDTEYGTRVAEGVGVDVAEVARLAAMTDDERAATTSR